MNPSFNSLKPFYYPFAGAWGSLVLSHAPVFFGAEAWGLLRQRIRKVGILPNQLGQSNQFAWVAATGYC